MPVSVMCGTSGSGVGGGASGGSGCMPNGSGAAGGESAAEKCGAAIRGSLSIMSSSSSSDGSSANSIHGHLLANAKRALLDQIEYEHSSDSSRNTNLDKLKSKYTLLNGNVNGQSSSSQQNGSGGNNHMGSSGKCSLASHALKKKKLNTTHTRHTPHRAESSRV